MAILHRRWDSTVIGSNLAPLFSSVGAGCVAGPGRAFERKKDKMAIRKPVRRRTGGSPIIMGYDNSVVCQCFTEEDAKEIVEALNHKCVLPQSIQDALNSGDGTYKP